MLTNSNSLLSEKPAVLVAEFDFFMASGCPQLLEILEILEISWNLIGPPEKLQNDGGTAGIYAVLVSWLDGTVMSVGRSSSSHAQLEIVHTLLVVVILLIKLQQHKNLLKVS